MVFAFPAYAEDRERFDGYRPADLALAAEETLDDLGWHISYADDERIEARTATGFWFFGDRMIVEVRKTTVWVRSECMMPTQCIDLGRNRQNVDRFLDKLDRKLRK